VKSPDDVLNAAFYLTAGDEVPITVLRNGEKLNFKIKPGEHPDVPRRIAPLQAVPTQGMPFHTDR